MSIMLWISVLDLLSIVIYPLYWNYVFGRFVYLIGGIGILRLVTGLSIIWSIVVARKRRNWLALSVVMAFNVALYFMTFDTNSSTYCQTGPGSSFNQILSLFMPGYGRHVLLLLGVAFMTFLFGYATWRVVQDFMRTRPS